LTSFSISSPGYSYSAPGWPPQTPPPVAGQTPPGQDGGIVGLFGFFLNGCSASEARQAEGKRRGDADVDKALASIPPRHFLRRKAQCQQVKIRSGKCESAKTPSRLCSQLQMG
jgi:hypothetical protein